jgi:hypothetical protein
MFVPTATRMTSFAWLGMIVMTAMVMTSPAPGDAFQTVRTNASLRIHSSGTTTIDRYLALYSNKDEEIAKLEEQLKRLKKEKASEAQLDVSPQNGEIAPPRLEEEEEVSIDMFLSEGWKEKEAAESSGTGGGGTLTTIAGVLALVVGLAVFSQVPIGQEDLSKYSAIKAPTEQIDLGDLNKARNSMSDL